MVITECMAAAARRARPRSAF